jgi:hypothetical protein
MAGRQESKKLIAADYPLHTHVVISPKRHDILEIRVVTTHIHYCYAGNKKQK